jgi:hypothetical protein
MNSNRTRLVAGVWSAILLSAPLALALTPNLILTNFAGTLRIAQHVPCGGVVDASTSIAGGLMDITPSQGRNGVQFHLTRLEVTYAPFAVQHECNGIRATADFREIGVRLAAAVKFTGEPIGNPDDLQYRFSIPKDQFLMFHSVVDNAPVQQPQTGYKRPSEDVTGVIDLRRGTTQLHVALTSRLRFRAGCVGDRCVIDEELSGTQTTFVTASVR